MLSAATLAASKLRMQDLVSVVTFGRQTRVRVLTTTDMAQVRSTLAPLLPERSPLPQRPALQATAMLDAVTAGRQAMAPDALASGRISWCVTFNAPGS